MFDQLFSCPRAVQRYVSAPLLESRLRYLHHCAAQGATSATLKMTAFYQRALSRAIDLEAGRLVRPAEIEAAADHWISRTPAPHAQTTGSASKVVFVSVARGWLGFLNRLEQVEKAALPCSGLIADFRDYMRSERGLSPATVYTRCLRVEEFLGRHCADPRALGQMTIVQIDAAIAEKGVRDRCTRASIRTYAYVLRSFFRYAETRGWCSRGLAAGIGSPRVYTGESLPAGPTWDHVQRLCAGAEGDAPSQIRDRAILLLFVVYGFRVGEVRRLRLDDVNWDAETIRITRSKQQRRIQIYPLAGVVGNALLRYLKTARPRRAAREVFLSLKAPIRPLGNSAFWQIVNRRLRRAVPRGLPLTEGPLSGLSSTGCRQRRWT
jgi:integrase/recombinase XerD